MFVTGFESSVDVELRQRADFASMALEIRIEAVRIAIETTVEATSS
jgi:hypothetical protein